MVAVQCKMIDNHHVQTKYFHLIYFLDCGNIFYVVSRDIDVGEELLVYYGDEYGQTLGINITQFSQGPFNNNGEKYVIELNEYKCTEKEG